MKLKYRFIKTLCLLTRAPRTSESIGQHGRARNQEKLIKVGVCSSVANTVASEGNIPSLFLLSMGADSLHIGLLATIMQASPFSKILGLKLLPFLGKARLCSWGKLLSTLPIITLAAIAFLGRDGRMIIPAIFLFALRKFIVVSGNTSWQPLIQDSIKTGEIGSFFARMRIKLRMVEITLPLFLGLFLGTNPSLLRFTPLFLIGTLATLAGCFYFTGVIEKPLATERKPVLKGLLKGLSEKPLRNYGIFTSFYTLVTIASLPLWVIMFKEYGIPASHIVWLGSASAAGNITGIGRWGKAVDIYGSKRVISFTLLPQAVLGVMWFYIPSQPIAVFTWAIILYFVYGFLAGGLGLAKTTAMIKAVSPSSQAEGFVGAGYMQALGGAAGGIIGGIAFRWITEITATPMGMDPRQIYFAGMHFALIPVWLFSRKITA